MRKRIFVRGLLTVGAVAVVATAAVVPAALAEGGAPITPTASNSVTVPIPGVGSKTVSLERNGSIQSFVTPYLQNASLTLNYTWSTATSAPVVSALQCAGGAGVRLIVDSLSNNGSVWGLIQGTLGDTTATASGSSETASGGTYSQEFGSGPISHDPTGVENIALSVCDT